MRKIELLAPAGSLDILKTAVHAGADAIYIGGPTFSARASANNFTYEEMKDGIEYAHFYKKKVFVAVNTLVKNEELKKIWRYAEELANLGPDAVIIQDMGIARLFQECIPELPRHASTQITATNRYGVRALKAAGFRRVVMAREVSIDEIAAIVKAEPEMQVEAFIHGAQCFSYSGQCLMSSMIGGRSGNRGQCAQPCRLPYELQAQHSKMEREGTLLSPKDLFGLAHLADMAKAGIHTLKIEGRLKNRDYVFYTVKAYRTGIDELQETKGVKPDLQKGSMKTSIKGIRQIFNREFSSGYLKGDLGQDLISLSRHNNKGILIGTVVEYNDKHRLLTIHLDDDLICGDGIYIENSRQDGFGFKVSEIRESGIVVTGAKRGQQIQLPLTEWDVKEKAIVKIAKGSEIYKSFSKILSQEIHEHDQPTKIGISFELVATEGQHVRLKYQDVDQYQGEVQHEYIVQKALNHPSSEEAITKQLNRLGNTPYVLHALTVEKSPEIIVPSSVLNELRRSAIDECTFQRSKNKRYMLKGNMQEYTSSLAKQRIIHRRNQSDHQVCDQAGKPILIAKLDNVALLDGLSHEYQRIYFAGDATHMQTVVNAAKHVPVYAVISSMIKENQLEQAKKSIEISVKAGVAGFVVNQIGQRELILEIAPTLEIVFDTGMHVLNYITYHALEQFEPTAINLSLELNKQQVKEFKKMGFVYIHGRYRLMISEHSLLTESKIPNTTTKPSFLKDRKGFELPTVENEFGQVEIFNPHVTSLLTELWTLKKHRHEGYIVDVSRDFYNTTIVKSTLAMYAEAYTYVFNTTQEPSLESLEELQQRLMQNYKDNLTKGHWQRGVK